MPRPPKNKPVPEPVVPVVAAPSVPVAVAPAAHNFKAPPVIDVDQFIRVRDSVSHLLFWHPRIPFSSNNTVHAYPSDISWYPPATSRRLHRPLCAWSKA
jgi:hypothetical protein